VQEILAERRNRTRTEYLVRWEGYGPEDDTWEPPENLSNAKGALRKFKARGRATKGGEYHVTASVTREIKEEKEKGKKDVVPSTTTDKEAEEENQANSLRLDSKKANQEKKTEPVRFKAEQNETNDQTSQEGMTPSSVKKRDSGTAPVSHDECPALTGKLCKRVLALIRWQCSADAVVDARMVQALEGWLRKRGISIYTEAF
jgi:hypothetical protein